MKTFSTRSLSFVALSQVIKRNREPHSGARWSKGAENKRTSSSVVATTLAGAGILTADEFANYKRQLEQLQDENQALKEALDEVRRFTKNTNVIL